MIPILYDKSGTNKLGDLNDILDDSSYVEEARNGIFELTLDYPNDYPLADQLIEENFIEVKPNDKQSPQKFRIYDTKKLMENVITVFARHESFDLVNDHVESVNLENASCEYALNTLFRNSHFSQSYRGYSDIVNAQNFKIDNVNILSAIAGKEGSIIDTYGTGSEILRDGKNIHVLNKRGHDNGVTIEYGKNLTGFELDIDLTGLETRCGGFAKYRPEGSQEDIIVKSDWIDSPFISNFAHPYISVDGRRDYSDKFKDGEIPTKEKLNKLCQDEFKINKRDIPANNYKINFIPLSKCVGYESVNDEISLCDTATIIDPRFNINTKSKVISYKYDFIKERYMSMELGESRTTLGDIIGGSGEDGVIGPQGPQGPAGNNGIDGKTTYFHIKYSNIANPTEPSQITETPSTYIGTYVDFTEKDSTDPKKYTWSRFEGLQGKNGEQGIPGTNGIDGKTTYLHIKYSNDGGKTFTSNNGETVGEWMGTYTDFNINDSRNPTDYKWVKIKGEQGIQGPVGADGKTTYTWIKYADTPSSGMSDFPEGKEYIGIAYNKTTATESNNYSDYSWSLIKGADGVQGPQGPQGEATYTWIKYADSPTSGMSDDPTNKIYMGIAYNKTTKKESTNYSDYSWSLIRGPQGPQGEQGIPGPQGPPGQDGNMENFPNTLPSTPVLSSKVYGFSTIELSWTFENKVYYQYELYASKTKDFKPNTFDLIHAGQTSSFLFQAKPNETWYFRVCAINTHGNRTAFSSQVTVTTKKVDDLSNYVDNMAIGEALIGELSLDRGWVGKLNANYLDVKGNFSVTDGNGKRTLDIDSFGNIYADFKSLKFRSGDVATSSQISQLTQDINLKVDKEGVISSINLSPEKVRLEANRIDLQGAVSAGGVSEGNYVYIAKENYNVYRQNVNTMTIGTVNKDGNIVPAVFMGANGHSGGANYGALFHMGNRQVLSHYNSGRKDWSEISLYSDGRCEVSPAGGLILNAGAGIGLNSHMFPHNQATIHLGTVGNPFSEVHSKSINLDFGGNNHGNIYGRDGRVTIEAKEGHDIYLATAYDAVKIDKDNGHLMPTKYNRQRLGNYDADSRWTTICLLSNPDISSDISLKENIEYVQNDSVIYLNDSDVITLDDMYNFVKNEYKLATYKYKGSSNETMGFIAQDLVDTKVGSKMIHENKDGKLSYDSGYRQSIVEGALMKAIEKIEELERRLIALTS